MAEALPNLVPTYPVTTAQPIKPPLSQGQIEAPFRDMADALDKSGAALSDVATNLAGKEGEAAGRNSIRTDDSGNLVVSDTRNPFIIGDAAKAYERSAKLAQFAQIQPKIETDILNLRLQNPNNPTGFQSAVNGYTKRLLDGDPDNGNPGIQDPHIRGAISDVLQSTVQQNLRSSLIETNRTNTVEAAQTYDARIKDLVEEVSSLSRQGAGSAPDGSDARRTYDGKVQDLATLIHEKVADPRFKYSPERANLELAQYRSEFVVQDTIGAVQRQFAKDHDLAKATTSLQNAFWGDGSDKLNLTITQRDRGVSEGLAHLRNMSTQDHEAIAENRAAVRAYIADMNKRPGEVDENQYQNYIQQSLDINDNKSVQELKAARDFLGPIGAEKRMSPVQRAAALRDLDRGVYPKPPDTEAMTTLGANPSTAEFFAGRGGRFTGVNPEFAGRLRTAIETYEKQNPGQHVDLTSLVRTNAEQQAAYQRYISGEGGLAAKPGSSRHEFGEAADIPRGPFLDWLHHNAPEFGLEFLRGSAFYKDPVHVQLPHGPLVPGSTVNLAENEAYGRSLQNAVTIYRNRVTQDAEKETADVLDRIAKGDSFYPGQLDNLGVLIGASGRGDLWDKVKPALESQDILKLLPPGETPSSVGDAVKQTLDAGPPSDLRNALRLADNRFRQDYDDMHKDPLGYGPRAEWFGAVSPIDPQQPNSWVANFQDRDKKIGAAQAWIPDIGPVSALRPDEAKAVGTQLTQGPPQQAQQLLTAIQTGLSDSNYRATLESEPIKNALFTAFASNDPNRIDLAGNALNRLWGTNPTDFRAKYGESAVQRLMAWKGLEGFTPEARAAKMQLADDPKTAKGRQELAETIDKELKDWTPQNTADSLGNFFQRNLPFVHVGLPQNWILGDALTANAFNVEFKEAVKDFRLYYGMDKSAAQQRAIEQLSATWRPSALNNGRLMKNAPELYYPQVNQSFDWMQKDLDETISKVYGPKLDTFTPAGEGFPVPTGWRLGGLIADNQTEREIQNGKPPSYKVHVIDAKGQDQLAPGRMLFDPRPAYAGSKADVDRIVERFKSQHGRDVLPGKPPAVAPGGFQSLGAAPFMSGGNEREPMAPQ